MGKNELWSKSPQERTQILAEHLRNRMYDYQMTEEQVVKCTRMDADRLHQVLTGEVVMNISDYVDVYYAIPSADESHIPADQLPRHHLLLRLAKLSYLKDDWNGGDEQRGSQTIILTRGLTLCEPSMLRSRTTEHNYMVLWT